MTATMRDVPFPLEDDELWGIITESMIGAAAEVLYGRGHIQAASLLLDVVGTSHEDARGHGFPDGAIYLYLLVPGSSVGRFDDDVKDQVLEAIRSATQWTGWWPLSVVVCAAPASGDWRQRITADAMGGPTNSLMGDFPSCDGLLFRSTAEVNVYEACKRVAAAMPATDRPMILPNARAKVSGCVREPDFLIVYKGRAGVIEVDGPNHRARAAADQSRDRLFEDHGVARVDRIVAEDTEDSDALDALVGRFLDKLAAS